MFSWMSFRQETGEKRWKPEILGRAPGLSSPLILAVPSSLTPELLRKHLHPLTGPGQPSLSDSDHNASSAFPEQNSRGNSGRDPVWPQGWWLDTWAPLWPPYQRPAQVHLRLPAVGQCCAHKLVSIQCQIQSLNCLPKYTLTWTFLCTLINQRLWPQRGSDIQAVMPGPKWTPQTYSVSSNQGMGPRSPRTVTSSDYCQTYRLSLRGISSGTSIPRMR